MCMTDILSLKGSVDGPHYYCIVCEVAVDLKAHQLTHDTVNALYGLKVVMGTTAACCCCPQMFAAVSQLPAVCMTFSMLWP